jgi:hypothetical protein
MSKKSWFHCLILFSLSSGADALPRQAAFSVGNDPGLKVLRAFIEGKAAVTADQAEGDPDVNVVILNAESVGCTKDTSGENVRYSCSFTSVLHHSNASYIFGSTGNHQVTDGEAKALFSELYNAGVKIESVGAPQTVNEAIC